MYTEPRKGKVYSALGFWSHVLMRLLIEKTAHFAAARGVFQFP